MLFVLYAVLVLYIMLVWQGIFQFRLMVFCMAGHFKLS